MTSTMFNDYEHVIVVMIRLNKYALISQQSSHYSSQDISTTYNYIEYKVNNHLIIVVRIYQRHIIILNTKHDQQ